MSKWWDVKEVHLSQVFPILVVNAFPSQWRSHSYGGLISLGRVVTNLNILWIYLEFGLQVLPSLSSVLVFSVVLISHLVLYEECVPSLALFSHKVFEWSRLKICLAILSPDQEAWSFLNKHVQKYVLSLTGPIVTMTSCQQLLAIVTHASYPLEGSKQVSAQEPFCQLTYDNMHSIYLEPLTLIVNVLKEMIYRTLTCMSKQSSGMFWIDFLERWWA